MPDLSPNLSSYHTGLGAMDPSGLLGLIQRSRDLQTQAGIAQALRANPNDPGAAMQGALANPNVYMGPEDISRFTQAQAAQFDLNRAYMREAAGAMGSLITKPGATASDFVNIIPLLRRYNVPSDMITDVMNSAKGPNGVLDRNKLASMFNWVNQNASLPSIQQMTPGGVQQTIPSGTTLYGGSGGGGAGVGPAAGAAPGVVQTNIPGATAPPEVSGKALALARDASSNYAQETYPLRATIHALEQLPEQGTGEGTEAVNKIKNFLTVIGADKALGINLNTVTNYEQAKKYMIQWANSVSAAGTNDRLSAAIAGNPNMTLLKSTNLTIAKTALALRRIQQVQLDEFDRSGLDPGQYQRWSSQWNKTQDPRAYAFDLMGRDNAAKLLKSLSPQERPRFEASLDAARRSGLAEGNL